MVRHADLIEAKYSPMRACSGTRVPLVLAYGHLHLQGPNSSAYTTPQSLQSADLSNAAFPSAPARDRHGVRARTCIRITYMGELGYELYIPADQGELMVMTVSSRLDANSDS